VATARIGPEATKVVFFKRSPLEQQPPGVVKNKDRERPVELSAIKMRGELLALPDFVVALVHQNHFVLHHDLGTDNRVLGSHGVDFDLPLPAA
jgi:hypothetical protein